MNKTDNPRSPLFRPLQGNPHSVRIELDGQANQQGCMTPVREGMRIRRQNGAQA